MAEIFTVEETNLICIYGAGSRGGLMAGLAEAAAGFEDAEMLEIAASALGKLSTMGDAEFSALALTPEYGEYDEGTEG
jgi:hypothetical protein